MHAPASRSYEDQSLSDAAGRRAVELLTAGGGTALKDLVPLLWAFGRQVSGAMMWEHTRNVLSLSWPLYPTYPPCRAFP
jgi:hypothetical protein